ncbi:MAG: glycosyltransferase family 4 protein [Candidatus Nanopelagicus sp.]|nr:glycosyltransferase family 4 protein [Candidatus Nanopelagicus sp.]
MKKIRIGMVCPYGWDTPGGVQTHIRDLADHLIEEGHYVSVLTPVSDDSVQIANYVVNAGKPISIPVNGSVAKILFGPVASSRAKQWIASEDFDLLHLHEPAIPSLSLLACSAAEGPLVGTFHVSTQKKKAIYAIGPILEPIVEKLTARIAVSELARSTLKDHFDTDAVVIPNGIDGQRYANAKISENYSGGHTVGFIGRFEESRKGLQVLIDSLAIVSRFIPDVTYLVAGPGESEDFLKRLNPQLRSRIKFLGLLTNEEKMSFLKTVQIYVAPNTGSESFGIILTEALSAGTAVVASDIPAFKAVLENGAAGDLFINGDSADLAKVLVALLRDDERRKKLAENGKLSAQKYDWQVVAEQIEDIYEMAISSGDKVRLSSENRFWSRR